MNLTTERLLLRPMVAADAPQVFAYSQGQSVGPNAGWKPHESLAETQEIMEAVFLNQETIWAIVGQETQQLMGSIGLIDDPKRDNSRAKMLGYALGQAYWGQGIMTEAAKAVLQYGFLELKVDLISAYCYPFNERSKNILRKLGFAYEGTLALAEQLYNGKVYDNDCFALTRQNFL